jgi:hypothetical protein
VKKRYIYAALFGIPGLILSVIITVFFTAGMLVGALWIFVFGDNAWPPMVEQLLPYVLGLIFLVLLLFFFVVGYWVGIRAEQNPGLNKGHLVASGAMTTVFLLLIVLSLVSNGTLGPKTDTQICSDYCTREGYSASGMPPRNSGDRRCSCFDETGNKKITIPLESITPLK